MYMKNMMIVLVLLKTAIFEKWKLTENIFSMCTVSVQNSW
jgi:hypothetical protein